MRDALGKTQQIRRLFTAFSDLGGTMPEDTARNYLVAVGAWDLIDVEAAVTSFIAGNVPDRRWNGLPNSAELGTECRRQSALRLESARRSRTVLAAPPFVTHSAESRERVRAMTQMAVDRLTPPERKPWWQRMEWRDE